MCGGILCAACQRGNQILHNKSSKSVDMIRGHPSRFHLGADTAAPEAPPWSRCGRGAGRGRTRHRGPAVRPAPAPRSVAPPAPPATRLQCRGNLQPIFKQSCGGHPIFPGIDNTRPDEHAAASAGRIIPHPCPENNPWAPARSGGLRNGVTAPQEDTTWRRQWTLAWWRPWPRAVLRKLRYAELPMRVVLLAAECRSCALRV
jgi:hypothetical protein